MRTLIIVESLAKARTVGNYLSKDYTVKASVAHIRDLPPHEWAYVWITTFGQRASSLRASSKACPEPLGFARDELRRRVAGLKKAARLANTVVLATDPDREGEAIAWRIQQVLRSELPDTVLRATFHEISVLSVVEGWALDRLPNRFISLSSGQVPDTSHGASRGTLPAISSLRAQSRFISARHLEN